MVKISGTCWLTPGAPPFPFMWPLLLQQARWSSFHGISGRCSNVQMPVQPLGSQCPTGQSKSQGHTQESMGEGGTPSGYTGRHDEESHSSNKWLISLPRGIPSLFPFRWPPASSSLGPRLTVQGLPIQDSPGALRPWLPWVQGLGTKKRNHLLAQYT